MTSTSLSKGSAPIPRESGFDLEEEALSPPILAFNGVHGATGRYALEGVTLETLLESFKGRSGRRRSGGRGVAHGVDPNDLSSAGWAVVFPLDGDPAVRNAVEPLLRHRARQVDNERRFRIFEGEDGLLPGESKGEFLARHGAGPGAVEPETVPYYLLLVGGPEEVPWEFQYQLDSQYAVGRLAFDSPWDYEAYAESQVAVETGIPCRGRKAAFLAPCNPDDRATELSNQWLVSPLQETLAGTESWQIEARLGAEADKVAYGRYFGGDATPALLFTAGHGLCYGSGDPLQRSFQGALLCQDWPGPKAWRQAIPEEHFFACSDVASRADVRGLIAFFFACYGAGTPRFDDFDRTVRRRRSVIAPKAMVSRLAQRLLAHPAGSASAVIGHVERAWSYSFLWRSRAHVGVFESTLKGLLNGWTVGMAMEYFSYRLADLGSELLHALENPESETQRMEILQLWAAHHDARNYVVLGDPAVRLAVRESPTDG
ncbi:MAG: hypothetical protein K0U98_05145 [Deltaproteobacteria bacterium]|nr:hypothetical protein [Deltaproteobacteria bacterium]